ncbi:MAG: FAD-binding protein, partial [Pseudomonadales bacterium]|nr:FAD-binding protein [Pseudomonadales bacterium]
MTGASASYNPEQQETDILIIGSGAAGLTLALRCAEFARVRVISKGSLREGATFYAQGGIAAVLDDHDSIEAHVADTLVAGVGLCHEDMVRFVVTHSTECVRWLVDQGVPFTTKSRADTAPNQGDQPAASADDLTSLHLTKEGGHSHRRIIHATDATGKAVFRTLKNKALEHPNVELVENHIAVDLLTRKKLGLPGQACIGAYVMDTGSNRVRLIRARFVVLATGGASKAYLYTTNPDGASGDGIAMAWRAGCRVANMEFNQFHPT